MPLERLEAWVREGRWDAARREAERTLRWGRLEPAARLQALVLGCRVCNQVGEYAATVRWGAEALAWAGILGDRRAEVLVRFDLGVAHLRLGNALEAKEHLDRFLAAPGRPVAGELTGKAWFNLGIAHRLLGRWRKAAACYRRAAAEYRRRDLTMGEIRSLLEAALCHLLAGEPGPADGVLAAVERGLATYPDSHLEALCQCLMAHRCRLSGEPDRCQALAGLVLAGNHAPEIMAHASWLAGENALDAGDPAGARRLAERALGYCRQVPFPDLVDQAYSLLRRSRAALGEEAG